MEVTGSREGEVLILKLTGRLDASTSPEVDAKIRKFTEDNVANLAGDLSGLEYISSAGLRILLMTAKSLGRQGGKMVLFGLRPEVRQVFEIAGFSKIIPLHPDKPAALAVF